ncbi:Palmitoyltransferase [Rhizophlyctis rosea]|nr:Palmitoyltransferase [Rhizophlyctis rosea]
MGTIPNDHLKRNEQQFLIAGINIALLIPLTTILGMLASYQFHYTLRNLTTIEYTEKRESAFAFEGGISTIKDPYDMGTLRNVKAILGSRVAWWLCPQRMEGDGYEFAVVVGGGDESELEKLV